MAEQITIALLNETIQQIPILSVIDSALEFLKYLVGGLFGFYVLTFLINMYMRRKEIILLKELNAKIDSLSKRMDATEKKKRK